MKDWSRPSTANLIAALISFGTTSLSAADYHVSPDGSGSRDGRSAGNAAAASSASAIFNDSLQGGDRLFFGPGEYRGLTLKLSEGGSKENPKSVIAARGAVFKSDWSISTPEKGATAITLAPGLSHVVLKDLSIRNYCMGMVAPPAPTSARSGLVFDNVDMDHIRHGFYLSDCDDLVIRGCDLKRYSKHGFRFDQDCDRVHLIDCSADCSEGDPLWETQTEVFTFGYIVNDKGAPNTAFVFEDCLATNNIKSNQTVRYTNGDGFVTEGNSKDITFIRCRALRNQDGGFDLKTPDVKLTDCIAIGHRRDFRIWQNATMKNCFSGGSQTGLWTKTGAASMEGCTFLGHTKSCIETDEKTAGPPDLKDCILVTGEASDGISIGPYQETGCVIVAKPEEAGIRPAGTSWTGEDSRMNSENHREKGYSSERVTRER